VEIQGSILRKELIRKRNMRNINCKRINQNKICLDNRMTKSWHLFKPVCVEIVSPMKTCEIKERYKKPKPPPAPPSMRT